jgi:hypothetical protein
MRIEWQRQTKKVSKKPTDVAKDTVAKANATGGLAGISEKVEEEL